MREDFVLFEDDQLNFIAALKDCKLLKSYVHMYACSKKKNSMEWRKAGRSPARNL